MFKTISFQSATGYFQSYKPVWFQLRNLLRFTKFFFFQSFNSMVSSLYDSVRKKAGAREKLAVFCECCKFIKLRSKFLLTSLISRQISHHTVKTLQEYALIWGSFSKKIWVPELANHIFLFNVVYFCIIFINRTKAL